MATMVVQFGLATMPLGMSSRAWALTSGTTSGTSGSMRQADELSITMAPAAATTGASSLEVDAPAENRAMSMPDQSAVAASSTSISASPKRSATPGRPARGHQAELVDRELALGQHGPHDAADLPGRPDDGDLHGARA